MFLFYQQPLIGEVYTYITITEVTFLSVLIWLAHRTARSLQDFEEAVENITMVNINGRVRSLDDASEDIQIEMFRSRNHHHPLSVILVEPEPDSFKVMLHQAVQEVQNTIMNSYVITKLADSLSRHLRRTDLVLEERDRGRFVILCPDTNVKDLKILVEYIQATAVQILGVSVRYGTATFPDEALTFEELVHQAEKKLQESSGQISEATLTFSESH
jgi:GGDEF domain-containing protein